MDPNLGSGNALLGGGNDALKQVMQQQGIDTGILDQQTPASAGFNPAAQQALPGAPAPTGQPMPPMPPPQAGGPTQPGAELGGSEAQLIIQVLGDRLKNISTVEKQAIKPPALPQAPVAPQVPQF